MNIKINNENFLQVKAQLQAQRKQIQKTINQALFDFWVTTSKYCGVYKDTTKKFFCQNYKEIQTALTRIKSRKEAECFVVLYYLSVDFVPNWRKKLAEAVLRNLGLYIENSSSSYDEKDTRDGKNFIERMVSQQYTNMCKNASHIARRNTGYWFTKKRWGKYKRPEGNNDFREPKHFYEWMVREDSEVDENNKVRTSRILYKCKKKQYLS